MLTVKEYHEKIATPNWERNRLNPKTMFFFYREDQKGYPTTMRKRGFVLSNGHCHTFYLTKEKLNNFIKDGLK